MTRTRCPAVASILIVAWASIHDPVLAAFPREGAERHGGLPRIRTADRRMRKLIDEGIRDSPSLHALVRRLEQSDVVVYVECEARMPSRVAGRLIFVSAVAGLRYVLVRLARLPSRSQQIAILAHELQHAVEIADTPGIVDGPSLAREYQRFGHVNPSSARDAIAFDTDAAVAMGQKVLGEVATATGD